MTMNILTRSQTRRAGNFTLAALALSLLLCSQTSRPAEFKGAAQTKDPPQDNSGDEEEISNATKPEVMPRECGRVWNWFQAEKNNSSPRSRFQTRIVGGASAKDGQFPAHAYIWPGGCGGVLVGKRHVLTAASCVAKDDFEPDDAGVILGSNSLPKYTLERNFTVIDTCISDRYNKDSFANLAVLKITPDVNYELGGLNEPHAYPSCLPKAPLKAADVAYAVGFGAHKYDPSMDDYSYPKNLQFLETKLAEPDERPHPADMSMLPLKVPGGTCNRDVGGGVYGWEDSKLTLFGIITDHDPRCKSNQFDAVDVSYMLDEVKHLLDDCR